jgi:hypothetical protein
VSTETEAEDLSLLTEEERAAFAALSDDDIEIDEDEAGEGEPDPEGEGDKDEGAEPDAGGEGEPDPEDHPGDGAGDEDAGKQPEPEPSPGTNPPVEKAAPILRADVPADADEQLKAIKAEKRELTRKFEEGDITSDDYQDQLEALDDRRLDIRLALKEAELATKMESQSAENRWFGAVEDFLSKNTYLVDTPLKHAAMDQAVIAINSDPENAGLSDIQRLEKARDVMHEQLGLQAPGGKQDPAPAPAPRGRRPDPVPTLAGMPAAAGTEVTNPLFAELDRLAETDPEGYERKLASLSEADSERYLRS